MIQVFNQSFRFAGVLNSPSDPEVNLRKSLQAFQFQVRLSLQLALIDDVPEQFEMKVD